MSKLLPSSSIFVVAQNLHSLWKTVFPPSSTSGTWALLEGFFLLQHNLQTVLRACEFVSIPANQPCVGVSTGQVPVGKTAPFLKLFPLRVCRCSKGYNVLKCTFCYHPYNCQKVIVQNAMTYIHFILVSLIMLRWIHFLRTPPTPSPQASWVECTLNTQEWGWSKKPGLRVGGQTVLRCVDQPMKRERNGCMKEGGGGFWSLELGFTRPRSQPLCLAPAVASTTGGTSHSEMAQLTRASRKLGTNIK